MKLLIVFSPKKAVKIQTPYVTTVGLLIIEKKSDIIPSLRQMQKWIGDYKAGTHDPTGVKATVDTIVGSTRKAVMLAEGMMMGRLSMSWLDVMRNYDLEAREAFLMTVLHLWEEELGRDEFERIVKKYKKMRDQIGPFLKAYKPRTS